MCWLQIPLLLSDVVDRVGNLEICQSATWACQPPAKTGTKLAKMKSYIERLIWNEFGLEVISQQELLHWGTGRYLMNWIQVVYIKLKEIWLLFSIAKAKKKKTGSFFLNERIPSPNLALKLAPNDNYFIEELVGILWIEFKLFISNWKRFHPYFPLLITKKPAGFLLPFRQCKCKYESMKPNLSQKVTKVNYFTKELNSSCLFQIEKEIWPLFSTAKDKKMGSFFTSLPPKQMKIWKYETKSQSKGY